MAEKGHCEISGKGSFFFFIVKREICIAERVGIVSSIIIVQKYTALCMAKIYIYSYILYNRPGARPYLYDYTEP